MIEESLISVQEAIVIIDVAHLAPRIVQLKLNLAQGYRLAQEIAADRDYPPFDKSLMDGYAVRCADVETTPIELRVTGEIAAGQRPASPVEHGQAIAIMTGAPMPEGADGVVPVEDVEKGQRDEGRGQNSSDIVTILRADGPHRYITRRGADCAKGTVVLARGTKLEAAQLAVAASVGAFEVDVFAKPRVAVLSTGDELVSIDQAPGPAQIRNSNNIMLVALLKRLGCEVTDLGIARDDPAVIRESIQRGLQFDALLISGGMSMGEYDFVPRILLELGVELKITKLKIKPGKPFAFGVFAGASGKVQGASVRSTLAPFPSPLAPAFVFGLPGNPVSSFVCALRLCSRLLLRLSGATELERFAHATLESPLEANGNREFYQPAIVKGATVEPLKWKGSADIYTLARANGLIIRAASAPAMVAGQVVSVLEIPS